MKNCTHCIHAAWERTKTGKLHPSGDGRCTKTVQVPQLPQALYWLGEPKPCGGHINRRSELKDHCVYFARNDQ